MRGDEALKVMLLGGLREGSSRGARVKDYIDLGMSVYRQHQFKGKIYPMNRPAGQPHFLSM